MRKIGSRGINVDEFLCWIVLINISVGSCELDTFVQHDFVQINIKDRFLYEYFLSL